MERRASPKIAERNGELLKRIRELKAQHPFWGYRRIWAHLRFIDGLLVNKKRILRLMREHHLLVKPNMKLKAWRTSSKPKPRPTAPHQWWGIDMTKIMVEGCGWVYLVVVLDWYTKKIVGYHSGPRSTAGDWLTALNTALNRQFPQGVREQGLSLMADNGSQPTSLRFMKACSTLGIHQAFTSYNNPKGNADTERMIRTLKEECLWLREWTGYWELKENLESWIEYYNRQYLHSTLGYKPPSQFENEYYLSRQTQLIAA